MIDSKKLANLKTEYTTGLWWIDFTKAWSLIGITYYEQTVCNDLQKRLVERKHKFIKRGRKPIKT